MKKSSKIIIVLVSILTIYIGYKYLFETKENENKDGIKFKEEYELLNNKKNENNGKTYPEVKINSKNNVKYSSYDEITEVIKSGTGVIYFGYPECPWCRNLVPVLLEAAEEIEIDNIYYLNIYNDRDILSLDENKKIIKNQEGNKNYFKLVEQLSDILNEYILTADDGTEVITGEKRIYVPLVVFVKDGKIVGHHEDTVETQTDPYIPLNDRQKEELLVKLVNYMGIVNGSICDESC